MALTQVTGPYPIFTDLDGSPLDDGYLYIGSINEDPEVNPIQVFWDSALTIPAVQPIRTNNGYAWRNGTPALIYTAGEFSITIRNKRGEFVLYSPVGYGFDPASVSASVVKNDFTGDGVTVDFTLSASPSTVLATNVFINGVYQEKNSYSLLGNVITFSIAPPLGSSIEVMTNETGVIGSTNSNLVSTAPGGTVQDQLTVNKVSPIQLGAVYDGITDDAPALTASFNESYPKVGIGTTTPIGATNPFLLMGTTGFIPYYGDIEGTGWRSQLHVEANPTGLENSQGATTGQKRARMLRANINASNGWVQQFPGPMASKISSLRFEAGGAAANGWQITAIEFGGGQHFKDIAFYDLTGGIRQMPTLYSDQVTAERLLMGGQLVKTTDADSFGYLVNLPYTGDGVLVSQCHVGSDAVDESGNPMRPRNVYFKFKGGACIDSSINGDHFIQDSRAVSMRGAHIETGRAHFYGSTAATFSDSLFFKNEPGTALDVAPIRMEVPAGTTTVRAPVVSLKNLGVQYANPRSNYSLTTKDLEVVSGGSLANFGLFNFEMLHRVDRSDVSFEETVAYGISTNIPTFDTYSHIASVRSTWRNGAIIIEGSLPSITAFSGAEMSASTSPWRDWRIASGTYYYRIALLYDVPRAVGTLATGEVSAATTLGGNGIQLTLNAVARRPGMLRVYRGTSAGVYDSVVNVPLMSGGRLLDTGEDIGGFAWQARTPGAADAVNAGSNGGYQLTAGSDEAGSDAYGRAVVLFTSNTLPTTGSWRRGDKIELQTPVNDTTRMLLGYYRATNCTAAATANVLNTDWFAVYTPL